MTSTISITEIAVSQLVVFRLADRTYGIELDTVREIISYRGATRLPGAPRHVAGLVNARGTIVTVIDLGARFDGDPSARAGGSVILIEHGAKLVGVAVDEVLDVRNVSDVEVDDSVAAITVDTAVRAVGRLGGGVITLLDIHGIISQVLA